MIPTLEFAFDVLAAYGVATAIANLILRRTSVEKEAAILWCLHFQPGMTGPALAEITGIERGRIYIHLSRLEEKGLVRHECSGHTKVSVWYRTANCWACS